jgi:hypothetical protein
MSFNGAYGIILLDDRIANRRGAATSRLHSHNSAALAVGGGVTADLKLLMALNGAIATVQN